MEKINSYGAQISRESEDLIRARLLDDVDFEKKDAEILLKNLKQLTGGKKYYLLTETNENFSATAEVRQYVAENIASVGIIANAICIKSLPIRFIINAYIKFNRPNIPTRTFNSESAAIEWIDDIRKSNIGKEKTGSIKKSKNLI